MASGPEGTEPANYQTWVLKVSIHCEGCKKKLKKILHKVKGVHSIDIDAKQNRVTVAGNVDAESLIQQLLKYGKHAELLPEKKNPSDSAAAAAKTEAKAKEHPPETGEKQQAEQGKAEQNPSDSSEITSPKPDTDAPSQQEKQNNSEKAATDDSDSKRKGKEVQREENRGDERELNSPAASSVPANFQPVYATMSYQTVHPSTSYAYYAAPPPEMSSSYAFYGNPPPPPPPAGYSPEYYYSSESYYGSMEQPAARYDMFNDENPNACKLM